MQTLKSGAKKPLKGDSIGFTKGVNLWLTKIREEVAVRVRQRKRMMATYTDDEAKEYIERIKSEYVKAIAKEWNIPEQHVNIDKNGVTRIRVPERNLAKGLPITTRAESIIDKLSERGTVLQRRLYGFDGRAVVDFDTSDHGMPSSHPTGAHKHVFNYRKKNPHGVPQPLDEKELEENSDIIKRGVNYND